MYLKSLELHGFKSFPNRTVLNFERGATVVVGPNGSGKSNISDAMRWVLGEISSKNIRGTKMEDVIFGGTDTRRPMGFAEVSVTFDNSERRMDSPYDEVTVTRRYYRSGESEYLINRKPVRLKDIHELFMNTGVGREGYSIIGQGKIAEMISKKSEDRRNIFEEAAGISKYRHRKEETQRKLNEAETNMVRVRDILNELEVRVGPLERDSEKARKYLELYEEKKRADVSLWLFDTEHLRFDIEKARENLALSKNELDVVSEALDSLSAQGDRVYEQTQKNKLASEQVLSKINDLVQNMHNLDNVYKVSENEALHRQEMIEQCKKRISEIDASEEIIRSDGINSEAKIEGLKEQLETFRTERLELLAEQQKIAEEIKRQEEILSESLLKLSEKEKEAVDLQVRINVIKNTQTTDESKGSNLLQQISEYEAEREMLVAEAKRCEESAQAFKDRISSQEEIVSEQETEISKLSEKRTELTERAASLKIEKGTLEQRVETLRRMEEHFEGYNESVRFIMKAYSENAISGAGEIFGPISKIISTDSKYVIAIETALGANMQNIVVDNDSTAKAAISALKNAKAGRATFYPISAIKPGAEPEEIHNAAKLKGYVGRADKLTSFDTKYSNIIEWLLGRTLVFDNIDNASAAAISLKYRVRFVTLDGQVINAGGSYTGGSTKNSSGILSRSLEIEQMLSKAKSIGSDITKLDNDIADINKSIDKAQQKSKDAEQQKSLLLSLSRAQFAALDSANAKLDAKNSLIEKIKGDYEKLTGDSLMFKTELKELSEKLDSVNAEIDEIKNYRNEQEVCKNDKIDRKDELVEEANNTYIRITEIGKDIDAAVSQKENADTRLSELAREKELQHQRIEEFNSKEKAQIDSQAENRKDYEAAEIQLNELKAQREEIEQEISEFDKRGAEIRIKTKEKSNQKELSLRAFTSAEAKLKRLTDEQDRLSVSLWENYEISYEQAIELDYPPVTAENRSATVSVQNSCKSKIKALGPVNVSAIEEYREVKERYDALKIQVDDFTRSYEELSDVVNKIEEEMRNNFIVTFAEINKNFTVVFKELFGGGHAELSLTEPDDVLTSGIEIKAAPPGKIIKSLSLLSGGEQAFVAIALLFAILKVNPSPFCILDEIEAALDEANVFRFGEYIKKFCQDTQFVLITHRRGTMEIADRLYGVTMPERGISRVLPLDVNEIESKKKELTDDGIL
ncbi:MAG: chromosome segregation protein SMC [Ruminococcaceae bacterium]|nr:chromosome segregation protein SMC [Oscillospiraceae bacterium]